MATNLEPGDITVVGFSFVDEANPKIHLVLLTDVAAASNVTVAYNLPGYDMGSMDWVALEDYSPGTVIILQPPALQKKNEPETGPVIIELAQGVIGLKLFSFLNIEDGKAAQYVGPRARIASEINNLISLPENWEQADDLALDTNSGFQIPKEIILSNPIAPIQKVAFRLQDDLIVSASNNTLQIWDFNGDLFQIENEDAQLVPIQLEEAHSAPIQSIAVFENFLASGDADGSLHVWDLQSGGDPVQTFPSADNQPVSIRSLAFPRGTSIAIGDEDGRVHLWNLRRNAVNSFQAHNGFLGAVALSPSNNLIVSGAEDGTLNLWGLEGTPIKDLESHPVSVQAIAFNPRGDLIVSGSGDGMLKIWNSSGELIKTIEGSETVEDHTDSIQAIAFDPGGARFVSGSSDATARQWDQEGNPIGLVLEHPSSIESIGFIRLERTSRNNEMAIVSATDDGRIWVWPTVPRPVIFHPSVILGIGDIAIVSYSFDAPAQLQFVLLVDIPETTEVAFRYITSQTSEHPPDIWIADRDYKAGELVTLEEGAVNIPSAPPIRLDEGETVGQDISIVIFALQRFSETANTSRVRRFSRLPVFYFYRRGNPIDEEFEKRIDLEELSKREPTIVGLAEAAIVIPESHDNGGYDIGQQLSGTKQQLLAAIIDVENNWLFSSNTRILAERGFEVTTELSVPISGKLTTAMMRFPRQMAPVNRGVLFDPNINADPAIAVTADPNDPLRFISPAACGCHLLSSRARIQCLTRCSLR